MGKNKKMAETNLLDIQWFLIQLNPSRIRMVSCLIFSANSWTPGKSSLCHALCDPFGTAACPVCHLALKIGAFNRRFWMFACFFGIMNKTHEHFSMIFVDFVLVNKIRRCIRISWNGRWNCRGFPGFFYPPSWTLEIGWATKQPPKKNPLAISGFAALNEIFDELILYLYFGFFQNLTTSWALNMRSAPVCVSTSDWQIHDKGNSEIWDIQLIFEFPSFGTCFFSLWLRSHKGDFKMPGFNAMVVHGHVQGRCISADREDGGLENSGDLWWMEARDDIPEEYITYHHIYRLWRNLCVYVLVSFWFLVWAFCKPRPSLGCTAGIAWT